MKMTAVEKHFVNSPGHAADVASRAERLLAKISVGPDAKYLDVGCGVGSAARTIAETRGLEVVGVDIDPEQIRLARSREVPPNLRFAAMDATRLEFSDGEFDVVSTSMTTHHIPGYERALEEMVRVLRPGGYLIYTDLVVPGWVAAVGRRLAPVAGYPSESDLDGFAARAGMSEVFRSRSFLKLEKIWRKG